MNTTNEEPNETDNMETLKPQSAGCGAGCGCHSGGAPGKARWGICAIVLIAAGVLVVRAMTKTDAATKQESAHTFATPMAVPVAASNTMAAAAPVVSAESAPATGASEGAKPAEASAGTIIGALAELNTVAAKNDAVFIYLLGKEESSGNAAATKAMQAAVRTIEAKGGTKCALFTLKAGSPDYANLASQVSLPGVLALVKGKGMSAVSGEITETKLVQSYVAASSAGGCGSGGSGGCAPGTPGCN